MILLLLGLLLGSPGEAAPGGSEGAAGSQDAVPGSILVQRPAGVARVYFWPGDSLRAVRLAGAIDALPPLPGIGSDHPSNASIYLAPDESVFDSLTGGAVPDWGAGVAIPSTGTIVLPAFASSRTRGSDELVVFRHEWAHIGLAELLDGLRPPRWFDEGYAQWSSGGWDASEGWRLRIAFAAGRAPPLDSLTLGFPRDRASAELAYLLAATAVEYLTNQSGARGLEVLFQRWKDAGSFESGFRSTYGVTSGQFEEDWRGYVRARYGWVMVLSQSVVFWGLLGLLLLGMLWIRRGRNRELMARLRATEPEDRPAYWDDVNSPPG